MMFTSVGQNITVVSVYPLPILHRVSIQLKVKHSKSTLDSPFHIGRAKRYRFYTQQTWSSKGGICNDGTRFSSQFSLNKMPVHYFNKLYIDCTYTGSTWENTQDFDGQTHQSLSRQVSFWRQLQIYPS
jgi:hypothetical protein